MPHMHAHTELFMKCTEMSMASMLPSSVVWFEIWRQLKQLHNHGPAADDHATTAVCWGVWGEGGATVGPTTDGSCAFPHLWIIWTQIVYLAFLKCYQCFLCAFLFPPTKKAPHITPKHHVPLGNAQFQHDHQQNRAKLTQRTRSSFNLPPHLFFSSGCPLPEMHGYFTQIKE